MGAKVKTGLWDRIRFFLVYQFQTVRRIARRARLNHVLFPEV